MSRLPSWRASVTNLALLSVLAAGVVVRVAAQDPWQQTYLEGEDAFRKHDYANAEKKFLDALARGPKSHGPNTPLVSQQRGFIPEYYLAIIYAETQRPAEALKFAGKAETYLDAKNQKDQVDRLKAAEAIATKAVSGAARPTQTPATSADTNTNKTTAPQPEVAKSPVDPFADAAASIQSALTAGRLDDAIRQRNQARAGGARGRAFDDASRAVDQKDFDSEMASAARALSEGRFGDAKVAATRARELAVDTPKVVSLESEIAAATTSTAARGGRQPVTAPTSSATPLSPQPPAPNPAIVDAQRRGLRALLSGDYLGAAGALQSAALDANAPRARFYLACAEAGLALTEPDNAKRSSLEAAARRDWLAVAASRPSFTADLRYISPAILRTLGIAPN